MGLTASKGEGGDFTPCPSGTHIARCCWLIDLGYQESHYQGQKKVQHKVLIGWEMPEALMEEGDRAGEPFFISNFYTLSLHEKSKLRPHLEAWRNRAFTDAELEAFDLRNILDKPCLLSITHEKKDDGSVRARVSGVSALMKGQTCPDRVNATRLYDQDQPDPTVYEALPEWVRGFIDKALPPAQRFEQTQEPSADDIPDEDLPF